MNRKRIFTVKFDLVQNVDELLKIASKEDIKYFQENENERNKEFTEFLKSWLIKNFDNGDVSWIENVDVEVKE